MDFASLKQKFSEVTKTATEKAKEFGEKALDFTSENLAKTPLYIQSGDEYAKILEEKRSVVIAYDEENPLAKEILLMLPVWQTYAFIDSATFRYMNTEKSERLIDEHGYSLPLEMRIFFQGNETARYTEWEEIKKWWSNARNHEYPDNFAEKHVPKSENQSTPGENSVKTDAKNEEDVLLASENATKKKKSI